MKRRVKLKKWEDLKKEFKKYQVGPINTSVELWIPKSGEEERGEFFTEVMEMYVPESRQITIKKNPQDKWVWQTAKKTKIWMIVENMIEEDIDRRVVVGNTLFEPFVITKISERRENKELFEAELIDLERKAVENDLFMWRFSETRMVVLIPNTVLRPSADGELIKMFLPKKHSYPFGVIRAEAMREMHEALGKKSYTIISLGNDTVGYAGKTIKKETVNYIDQIVDNLGESVIKYQRKKDQTKDSEPFIIYVQEGDIEAERKLQRMLREIPEDLRPRTKRMFIPGYKRSSVYKKEIA